MKKHVFCPKQKDRRKVIRSIVQVIIIIFLIYIIIQALFSFNEYNPFENSEREQLDEGFIAISYFGVDPIGNEKLISKKNLEKHIKALKASGYITITQEDIKDYYIDHKPLPSKSLFLMFEDGRRDTGVFAQKVLEKYNYKASILSYGENLEVRSSKFLSPSDLRSLLKSSYWEIGTNGYRLSYINVFDRHGNFFNQLNTNEYQSLSSYLDRNYNHYLMDYIRDEYGIPMEGFNEMKKRISHDYKKVQEIYRDSVGEIPGLYAIMHSNTGKFGTNDRVSEVNEEWIYKLFDINFNREGSSKNLLNSSIYDLTRMQPQAHWSTNHLLMRIKDDTKQDIAFVSGDLSKKKDWDTLLGESEFVDDEIILTSLPKNKGLMFLKNGEEYKDINLSVFLNGNKAGSQVIYLRAKEDLSEYISIKLINNILNIFEKKGEGKAEKLFSIDLDIHDGIIPQSMEENKLESEIQYIETKIKSGKSSKNSKELIAILEDKKAMRPKGIEEGEEEYIPKIDILEKGERFLEIKLKDNLLSLNIDNKEVFRDMEISLLNSGYIGLESSYGGYEYSQRNLIDDVYDGIFKELVIKNISLRKDEANEILYSNKLTSWEKIRYKTNTIWEKTLNWFIQNL